MTKRIDLIRTHLQFAVPLRMAEWRDLDPDVLVDAYQRARPVDHLGSETPTMIPGVDELMYGDPASAGESMRRFVDGLAVAALVADGGVTLDALGLHFCRNHQHCLDVRGAA